MHLFISSGNEKFYTDVTVGKNMLSSLPLTDVKNRLGHCIDLEKTAKVKIEYDNERIKEQKRDKRTEET